MPTPCPPSRLDRARRRATRVRARPDEPIGTLYDVPVSNNGARCRLLARWLKVYHLIDVVDPTRAFDGGIKGPAYEAINPQLKMPALTLADESMSLGESEVINQYLLDYGGAWWSEKRPRTPEARAWARWRLERTICTSGRFKGRCIADLWIERRGRRRLKS